MQSRAENGKINDGRILSAILSLMEHCSSKAKLIELALEDWLRYGGSKDDFPISEIQEIDHLLQLHNDITHLIRLIEVTRINSDSHDLFDLSNVLDGLKLQTSREAMILNSTRQAAIIETESKMQMPRSHVELF